jgi:hypothetical protein
MQSDRLTLLATVTFALMLGANEAPAQEADVTSGFGHTVRITRNRDSSNTVVADGKVLYIDRDDMHVSMAGFHQSEGRVYALVAEASGGNACPSQYRAIAFDGAKPMAGAQFGTCSDGPKVTAAGGKLLVTLPGMDGKSMVTYTVAGTRITETKTALAYGNEGPPASADLDLAEAVAGRHISEAVKQRAVMQALRQLVGEARAAKILDYAVGGPGTAFESRGNFVVATACMAHFCNINHAAVAFGHDGKVWVSLRTDGKLAIFGNPPDEVRRALTS